MKKQKDNTKVVSGIECASYGLYFMGQNLFYILIYMYLSTYYTDIMIPAAAVSVIALVVKIWDAVNDPIFGALMDKIHFKKGTFVPWLRISLVGIPIATILMFATPISLPPYAKIIWAVVAYMLWDTAYTICDVPIFGLVTTITPNQEERTSLNAIGRICAMVAALVVTILIPSFREKLGGWTSTVVILSIIGAITMIPICFTAKERVKNTAEKEPDYSLKDMFSYLKTNKYLLIFYIAFLFYGAFNVANSWTLYISRYCFNDEAVTTYTGLLSIVPVIILGFFVPSIIKKVDKLKLFYISVIVTLVTTVIRYFVGYGSLTAYLAVCVLQSIPLGIVTIITYMFTPDCVEYGHYITGQRMPGITFATQTFFVKLQSAVLTSFAAAMLTVIHFTEGENAIQVEGFTDNLWLLSCLLPAIGYVIVLVILKFYKLNDHDVKLMSQVNTGEITREEAEKLMINKY